MNKPRIYKRNGLWTAQKGDRQAFGHTPRLAYIALMWKFRDSVYG